jgi:hypothetical protein
LGIVGFSRAKTRAKTERINIKYTIAFSDTFQEGVGNSKILAFAEGLIGTSYLFLRNPRKIDKGISVITL